MPNFVPRVLSFPSGAREDPGNEVGSTEGAELGKYGDDNTKARLFGSNRCLGLARTFSDFCSLCTENSMLKSKGKMPFNVRFGQTIPKYISEELNSQCFYLSSVCIFIVMQNCAWITQHNGDAKLILLKCLINFYCMFLARMRYRHGWYRALTFSTSADQYIKRQQSLSPKSEKSYSPSDLFLWQCFLFVDHFCTDDSVCFLA